MAGSRRLSVSDAELEVLKVLWNQGPAPVRDVVAALGRRRRRLAYNTVLTLLTRLREKGCVTADRRDTPHVFRAAVTREDLLGADLAALADRVCDGMASPLVHALVTRGKLSAAELDELRRLVDDLTPED